MSGQVGLLRGVHSVALRGTSAGIEMVCLNADGNIYLAMC